jgi:hypothetical protein
VERQSPEVLAATVNSCIDECPDAEIPLAVVAATIERLKGAAWHAADIRHVELVVHKILVGLVAVDKSGHVEITVPVTNPAAKAT